MSQTNKAPTYQDMAPIRLAIMDIRRLHKKGQTPHYKDAVIQADLFHIISSYPADFVAKSSESSAFLLSLYTGARAVTVVNIKIKDIINVFHQNKLCTFCTSNYLNYCLHNVIVQIKFTRTKGLINWNHVVSLDGGGSEEEESKEENEEKKENENKNKNEEQRKYLQTGRCAIAKNKSKNKNKNINMNFVFHLARHLKLVFDIDLLSFDRFKISSEILDLKIWNYTEDSLRERFKSRAVCAGYPRSLFSYHSLRSGFICSAIINAGTNPSNIEAVLENTAYVADWIPRSACQMRYVKDTVKRLIISNRLVLPTKNKSKLRNSISTSDSNFNSNSNSNLDSDSNSNSNSSSSSVDRACVDSKMNSLLALFDSEEENQREKTLHNKVEVFKSNNNSFNSELTPSFNSIKPCIEKFVRLKIIILYQVNLFQVGQLF